MNFPISTKIEKITMNKLLQYFDHDFVESLCTPCPNYSKIWSCPNLNFNPEEYFKKYDYAYIISSKINYSDLKDSNFIIKNDATQTVNNVYNHARKIIDSQLLELETVYADTTALFAGRCMLCTPCTRIIDKPCVNPHLMRYSLESLGIHVSKITNDILNQSFHFSKDGLPEYCLLISCVLSDNDNLDISTFLK